MNCNSSSIVEQQKPNSKGSRALWRFACEEDLEQLSADVAVAEAVFGWEEAPNFGF